MGKQSIHKSHERVLGLNLIVSSISVKVVFSKSLVNMWVIYYTLVPDLETVHSEALLIVLEETRLPRYSVNHECLCGCEIFICAVYAFQIGREKICFSVKSSFLKIKIVYIIYNLNYPNT